MVLSGFVGYVKKVKNERGDPLVTKKFSNKKSYSAEKNRRGTLSVPSGFVGYLEKVKKKGGTFGLKLPWPRTWP